MRQKSVGRRKHLEIQARRVALKVMLAVLATMTLGLLGWLLLGRPHRHGRRLHRR